MRETLTTCPTCGVGKVPIPEHLEATLALVPKRGTVCSDDVAKKLSITQNAANNRLMDLLLLGLVMREKDGKFWRYSRA